MRQNDLHLLVCATHDPDSLKRLFCFADIPMDTAHLSLRILPRGNGDFPRQDPPIMARITGEIDPLFPPDPSQDVQVSRKMARRIDDVEATILEEVDRAREVSQGPPSEPLGRRRRSISTFFFFPARPMMCGAIRRYGRIKRRRGWQLHDTIFGQQVRLEVLVPTSRRLIRALL